MRILTEAPPGSYVRVPIDSESRRRTAVSAEAFGSWHTPSSANIGKQVFPKSEATRTWLERALKPVLGEWDLDEKATRFILDRFQQTHVSRGQVVITQGDSVNDVDPGLYILEEGELSAYKTYDAHGSFETDEGSDGQIKNVKRRLVRTLVRTYRNRGDVFGELAILYDAPRAATILSNGPSTLWSVDRGTVSVARRESAQRRREGFMHLLKSIEPLEPSDRARVVDALEVVRYMEGDIIIQEGEPGESFFLLLEGYAAAQTDDGIVHEYSPNSFFGELALLRDEPRAATVVAVTSCICGTLDWESFKRIVGPLEGFRMQMDQLYGQQNRQPGSRMSRGHQDEHVTRPSGIQNNSRQPASHMSIGHQDDHADRPSGTQLNSRHSGSLMSGGRHDEHGSRLSDHSGHTDDPENSTEVSRDRRWVKEARESNSGRFGSQMSGNCMGDQGGRPSGRNHDDGTEKISRRQGSRTSRGHQDEHGTRPSNIQNNSRQSASRMSGGHQDDHGGRPSGTKLNSRHSRSLMSGGHQDEHGSTLSDHSGHTDEPEDCTEVTRDHADDEKKRQPDQSKYSEHRENNSRRTGSRISRSHQDESDDQHPESNCRLASHPLSRHGSRPWPHGLSLPAEAGQVGLKNPDVKCFMNAGLQCLSHIEPFAAYFLTEKYLEDIKISKDRGCKGELARAVAKVQHLIWQSKRFSVQDPSDIRDTMAKYSPLSLLFEEKKQHDVQEFLQFFLFSLDEDLNRVVTRPPPISEEQRLEDERMGSANGEEFAAALAWLRYLEQGKSYVVDLFQGQMRSTVTCQCKHKSRKFEPFLYLSVPVAEGMTQLNEAIEKFLEEELLSGTDQWYCSECECKRDAYKKIDLWKLPPVLVITLKRFNFHRSRGVINKIDTLLASELTLDLSRFCSKESEQQKEGYCYEIISVANHIGSTPNSGHYTATCRVGQSWYNFNDFIVESHPATAVIGQEAYVIFMARRRKSSGTTAANHGSVPRQSQSNPENWPHSVSAHNSRMRQDQLPAARLVHLGYPETIAAQAACYIKKDNVAAISETIAAEACKKDLQKCSADARKDKDAVDRIVELGFDRTEAEQAHQIFGDVEMAINFLFEQAKGRSADAQKDKDAVDQLVEMGVDPKLAAQQVQMYGELAANIFFQDHSANNRRSVSRNRGSRSSTSHGAGSASRQESDLCYGGTSMPRTSDCQGKCIRIRGDHVGHGQWFGFGFDSDGAFIESFYSNAPENHDLKIGDRLVSINGQPVSKHNDEEIGDAYRYEMSKTGKLTMQFVTEL